MLTSLFPSVFLFSRYAPLAPSSLEALLEVLLAASLCVHALAVCPPVCTCSRSHREVDCSRRGLRHLPDGLQHNVQSLNLSHNRLHNLDGQLTEYTHLRSLDLSHNRLSHLPASLPRSLWQLHASSNRLRLLDKNDTVHQWNLRVLDLSNNKLERAVFINNTLINLCTLNLSHNQFWTLPTNMPRHLKTVDLSHNLLVNVLPGSLDQLARVTHLYLQANRFSTLPSGVLDKLTSLSVISLGNNPWACHLYDDVSYLLSWTQHTSARVLGCPCHTQPVCGGVQPDRTGGWHYASYNQPPLAASAHDSLPPEAGVTGWWYLLVSSRPSTQVTSEETWNTPQHAFTATPITKNLEKHPTSTHLLQKTGPSATERTFHTDSQFTHGPLSSTSFPTADLMLATHQFLTTGSPSIQTRRTTTLRTRSVRRQNHPLPGGSSSSGGSPLLPTCSPLLHKLGLLYLIMQTVM